jgi:ABC-type phosphate transport system permease subunit
MKKFRRITKFVCDVLASVFSIWLGVLCFSTIMKGEDGNLVVTCGFLAMWGLIVINQLNTTKRSWQKIK